MNDYKLMNTFRAYRRMQIELRQDNDGFWGWTIGNHSLTPTFRHFSSAFHSAKLYIDKLKRAK